MSTDRPDPIGIRLTADQLDTLDQAVEDRGFPSRNAAIRAAIGLLLGSTLTGDDLPDYGSS